MWRAKDAQSAVKYHWEVIADNLKKRGWSLGYVSAIDLSGRVWIADADRDDVRRFIVRGHEKLTFCLELEAAICSVEQLPAYTADCGTAATSLTSHRTGAML